MRVHESRPCHLEVIIIIKCFADWQLIGVVGVVHTALIMISRWTCNVNIVWIYANILSTLLYNK